MAVCNCQHDVSILVSKRQRHQTSSFFQRPRGAETSVTPYVTSSRFLTVYRYVQLPLCSICLSWYMHVLRYIQPHLSAHRLCIDSCMRCATCKHVQASSGDAKIWSGHHGENAPAHAPNLPSDLPTKSSTCGTEHGFIDCLHARFPGAMIIISVDLAPPGV